jgi:hypothetical protein
LRPRVAVARAQRGDELGIDALVRGRVVAAGGEAEEERIAARRRDDVVAVGAIEMSARFGSGTESSSSAGTAVPLPASRPSIGTAGERSVELERVCAASVVDSASRHPKVVVNEVMVPLRMAGGGRSVREGKRARRALGTAPAIFRQDGEATGSAQLSRAAGGPEKRFRRRA